VLISDGSTWTRRALEEADLPSLSISKITGLQSVLDGKSNTGHSHLWADITDKPSTFTPSSHVHAIADITSLQTTLDGKLDKNHVSNNVYNYRSVFTIRFTGVTHNTTGTLKINLPSSWNNVRYRFEMRGYAYSTNFNTYGSWRYVGSGFAYSPDSRWYLQGGHFLEGNPYFNQVRYTHDGSRCCILLGNTTTTWTDYTTFPVIIDIDVITDGPISRDGWSFEVLTSEEGYAWGNIQSTTPSIYGDRAVIPNTALIGKTTATGGYKLEVEGHTLVNGTLKANDFGDDWVDYSSSIGFTGFNATGLTKKVYYKKEGKKITIVFYFNGTCNGYYFTLNHTTIGHIKSEHMLADKSLYTGILHYDGYINGFASTIVENLGGQIRIRAITSDGNRFPSVSDGQSLTIRGSFTYYTD
jgi:hypothetical protein